MKANLLTKQRAIATALVVASSLSTQALNAGTSPPKIVGGEPAAANAYPWMAALLQRGVDAAGGQFCGGTLIAENWVLTAAHCVEGASADNIDVMVGNNDLSSDQGERIAARKIEIHPDYASRGYPDIALVQLTEPSQRAPVELVRQGGTVDGPGTLATAIGWGVTDPDDSSSSPSLLQ